MFGNQSQGNSANNNNTNSLFSNTSSGLFSNVNTSNTPGNTPGGLFSLSNTNTSLFGNGASSQLKTTQRKQGGLFSNIATTKHTKNEQPPKLSFPGFGSTPTPNSLFGGKQQGPSIVTKQDNYNKSSGFTINNANTLFPKPSSQGGLFSGNKVTASGGLFGNTITPSGGLFADSNKSNPGGSLFGDKGTTPGQQLKSQPPKVGGLFNNINTSVQSRELFLKTQKPNLLPAASTQNRSSLFSTTSKQPQPAKRQKSPLNNNPSTLFSSNNQNASLISNTGQTSSLFGSTTQKVQNKPQHNNNDSSQINNTTPNTPLFGASSFNNTLKQNPKFSLTVNLNTSKDSITSLVNKNNQSDKSVQISKSEIQNKNIPLKGSLFGDKSKSVGVTGSLFGNQKPKQSAVNSSGLFLGNQNIQTIEKKQNKKQETGTLFTKKQAENKKIQEKPSLFANNTSLFGNNLTQSSTQKQPAKINPQKEQTTTNINPSQHARAPSGLLATFSHQENQPTSRQARTISFNQNITQSSTQGKKGMLEPSVQKKSQPLGTHITQSSMKSSNIFNLPNIKYNPLLGQQSRQSFFKTAEVSRPQIQKQQIYTSFQITKLLNKNLLKKSPINDNRSPQQRISKTTFKTIQKWISLSFSRFNQIPTSQILQKKFNLHENQDINRFLNDMFKQVVILVNLPYEQKSFKLVEKLLEQLLDKLSIKQTVFNCARIQVKQNQIDDATKTVLEPKGLNSAYFIKHQIYKFLPQSTELNLDSQQLQQYIHALVKKFITNQLQYLQMIENKIQLLRLPSQLFYDLLTYCLKYKKFRISSSNIWNQKNIAIINLIGQFQKKIIQRVVSQLSKFVDQNFYSFLLINKQYLPELIDLVENFSYVEEQNIIVLSLKTILNIIQLGSTASSNNVSNISTQFKNSIRDTKSLQLLPFRTLLSVIENNSQRLGPQSHDLYKYISGPEWIDWLQICLNNTNSASQRQISPSQARYLIKILKYPSLGSKKINRQKLTPKQSKYIQNLQKKILIRKRPIFKFILALKQQNMLNMFYDILASLIYDYDSYRRIQQLFFKQKDEINYQFKNLIAEICNYPTQQFKEEIMFMEEKIHYFLRIVEVAPQKTLALEKLIFEGGTISSKIMLVQQSRLSSKNGSSIKTYNQQSQVGHKICHLIIDTTNYFGLKNNQKIVAKCISAIKSLLQKPQTSLAMKIAMAVNKPSILFTNNSIIQPNNVHLNQPLIKEMMDLLEYFLVSEQFTNTVSVKLHTNNSDNIHLQRMYSVRYSDKDYLPFVKQIIQFQYNSKLQKTLYQNNAQLKQRNIILTYSSYWFLKALEVFVRAFKQQKISSSRNQRKLLYLLNLILEKFFVLPSSKLQNLQQKNRMVEQSLDNTSNPIYSISSSIFIPKIYQYMTQALNAIDILPTLCQMLKYKILKSGYLFDQKDHNKKRPNYVLTNQKLEQDFNQNQFNIFLSVRILKQLLQTYRLYQNYKNKPIKKNSNEEFKKNQRNFMFKILSKLKCIHELQFSMFLKGYSTFDIRNQQIGSSTQTNLVIGLIALLIVDNQGQDNGKKGGNSSQTQQLGQTKPINLKHQNYQKPYIVPIQQNSSSTHQTKKSSSQLSNFNKLQSFYSSFSTTLNYESLNNFLVLNSNKYIESYESIEYLVVSCLGLLISGETIFGEGSCDRSMETTINISKYVGLYNLTNLEVNTNELFSNEWLLQKLEKNLIRLLFSRASSIQIKHSILTFIFQIIKNDKANSNFLIGKKIFYKYLSRHLEQEKYYLQEEFNRINVIVVKILNILEQKDHEYFVDQAHDKFLDALLLKIIANCTVCIKSATQIVKILSSFKYKQNYELQFSYFHLERTAEQREIIKVGQAYELLKQIIILVQKRFFDHDAFNCHNDHRWRCIKKLNNLIINLNLSSLTSVMVDQHFTIPSLVKLSTNTSTFKQYPINTNIPRSFSQNPFEVFIIQATHSAFISDAFQIYKQNIIDWVSFYSIQLCQVSIKFLTWILTVDKSLYGNQPNQIKSWQLLEKRNSNIICSLHMGSYKHNAVQLFADSQSEAINIVKNLFDQTLKNLQKGMTVNQIQSFSILGFCLQWLRARNNTELILQHLTRSTIKNNFWISSTTVQNSVVVKFILSLVSIGKTFMQNSELKHIKQPIINVIHTFKQGKSQVQQILVQQLISVLISIPPQLKDSRVFRQILTIWKTQTNNQFFYNEARLVLQMAGQYPNELAKNKILTDNRKIQRSSGHSQYVYNLRNPDSIGFIWALKIAATMMSTEQQTVLIMDEVSQFYSLKRQYISTFLLKDITNLTLGYLQELQASLQFLLTLISSKSWLIVQRKQFQRITYIISHKLINVFTDYMNSKLNYLTESDMQQRFKKIRFESLVQQISSQKNTQSETYIDRDSVFKMILEMKMIKCMKLYTILLNQCFQQSWYVHKYFNEEVYENYRYGVSFWDRINKSVGDMVRYNVVLLKKWKKTANLGQKLVLVKQCTSCSQYFVQSGYLTSILDLPSTVDELFEDIYCLNLESLELGTVHLMQQKSFRQKYQCLMKGSIQKYTKRLIQNVKVLTTQFQAEQDKIIKFSFGQIKKINFQKIQRNLTNILKTI